MCFLSQHGPSLCMLTAKFATQTLGGEKIGAEILLQLMSSKMDLLSKSGVKRPICANTHIKSPTKKVQLLCPLPLNYLTNGLLGPLKK